MEIPLKFISTHQGEIASLGAALVWAVALSMYRRYGYGVKPWGLNLFKNWVGLAGIVLLLLVTQPVWPTDPSIYLALTLSGLAGITLGDTAGYSVLRHLGAPAAAASVCLGPPLSAMLAFFFLGESLSTQELMGMSLTVLGVGGALLYTQPASVRANDTFVPSRRWGIFWLVLGGLGHSVGVVLSRYGMPHVDSYLGTFLRLLPAQLFLLGVRYFQPSGIRGLARDRKRLGLLIGTAMVGTFLGLILMSVGLKYSKAGIATALMSTYPLWVVPIAHFMLGERVRWEAFVFTVVACLGCVLIVLA